jgi:Flp pilus assembly protein TadD
VTGAASAHFARALELAPGFDAAVVNLAILAMTTGAGAKAEDDLIAAGERPGASPEARARAKAVRAARASREGRWKDAKALYREILEGAPDDVAVLNNLAVAEDRLGETREALVHFGTALEARPGDPTILNNVGVVHVHRGEWTRAEESFRGAIRSDARFHRAFHNLGVVLGAQGDRAGALAAFRRAASLSPEDASAVYNLAVLDREAGGDRATEKAAYERALSLDPTLSEAHLALGALLADPTTPAALRDESAARSHLERFLSIADPDDVLGRKQASDWLSWLSH